MDFSEKLILIVDDNPSNIKILANTLGDTYRITIAKSGEAALELIGKQVPDLILLDILMPVMDGFEVCNILKSSTVTRDIPIIFITAMDEAEQKTKGFDLGAVDYITRPFHSKEVQARVRTHLSLRDMQVTLEEKNVTIHKAFDEKSRQLNDLISNLPGMVYRCEYNGGWSIEFVSDGCRDLTGYSPQFFTKSSGRHFDCIAVDEDKKSIEEMVDKALSNKISFEHIYRIVTSNGNEKWVLEQGVGVYGENAEIIGIEGVVSDVTEKQNAALALALENKRLKSKIIGRDRFGDIIGISRSMQKVYDLILQASSGDDSVIVYGPSGTGKELVAKAIHNNSSRKEHPFIPINCGAIPEDLFESEFFGHKKGSFSGAGSDKKGILDMADGGTLFLDELGEISFSLQVKLLRVMDGNGYIPVGGTKVRRTNIRIICATNRDLQQMVRQKKLREDFFFRIHIIPITLPPLKERREDIPLLIEHFLNSYPKKDGAAQLTPEMIDAMVEYSWPGNIRQLQNTLYQFLTIGKLEFLNLDGMGLSQQNQEEYGDLREAVEEFEKTYIIKTMKKHDQKKGLVADALGVDRKTLFRKMKRYSIG